METTKETRPMRIIGWKHTIVSATCPRCGKAKMQISPVPDYAFYCPECDEDYYLVEIKNPGADCFDTKREETVGMLQLSYPVSRGFYIFHEKELEDICEDTHANWRAYDDAAEVLDIGWYGKHLNNTDSEDVRKLDNQVRELWNIYVHNTRVLTKKVDELRKTYSVKDLVAEISNCYQDYLITEEQKEALYKVADPDNAEEKPTSLWYSSIYGCADLYYFASQL